MKKSLILILFVFLLTSGCSTTFGGTVLVLSFSDILLYVLIAFVLALAIAFKKIERRKKTFWIWFIINLILTPLSGFIYLLFLFSKKAE